SHVAFEALHRNASARKVRQNPEVKRPLRKPAGLDTVECFFDVCHCSGGIHRLVLPIEARSSELEFVTLLIDRCAGLAVPELHTIVIQRHGINEIDRLFYGCTCLSREPEDE